MHHRHEPLRAVTRRQATAEAKRLADLEIAKERSAAKRQMRELLEARVALSERNRRNGSNPQRQGREPCLPHRFQQRSSPSTVTDGYRRLQTVTDGYGWSVTVLRVEPRGLTRPKVTRL